MPIPHYRPISYVKTAILWSLYYLRKDSTYEEAVKDIISRGGDTKNNAAIVGGLIGAAKGIGNCKKEIVGIEGVLDNVSSIVKNAPERLIVNWSG
jgi:ADP-ribosylglycohydrolase